MQRSHLFSGNAEGGTRLLNPMCYRSNAKVDAKRIDCRSTAVSTSTTMQVYGAVRAVWCIAVCYSCVTKGQRAAGMLAFKVTMLSLASLYRSSTRRTDVCAMTEGERRRKQQKSQMSSLTYWTLLPCGCCRMKYLI